MSDIVYRLRRPPAADRFLEPGKLLADMQAEQDEAADEIERLRAALREIADFEAPNFKWTCQTMRRKAKEALSDGRD